MRQFDSRKSRESLLIEQIQSRLASLSASSLLDYEAVTSTLRSQGYPLTFRRMAAISDIKQLEAISKALTDAIADTIDGLTWDGVTADGTPANGGNPYLARRGEIVLADASAASFTVRLPDPSLDENAQAQINVKLVDQAGAFEVTVDVAGGGTIDGDPSVTLSVADVSFTFYVVDGEYKVI